MELGVYYFMANFIHNAARYKAVSVR